MTTRARQFRVPLGGVSPVSLALALILVVPAAMAAQTSQRTQKQRRAGQAPVGQELDARAPAALEQPSARWARPRAVKQPSAALAAPAVAPRTYGATAADALVADSRESSITARIVRRAIRVGFPTTVPPGPASPIR